MPRKRKEALLAKAKAMHEAKRQRRQNDSTEAVVEEASSSLSMNESFMLPAPTEYSDVLSGESSEDDEDYEGEASDEEISSVYADWINELD